MHTHLPALIAASAAEIDTVGPGGRGLGARIVIVASVVDTKQGTEGAVKVKGIVESLRLRYNRPAWNI